MPGPHAFAETNYQIWCNSRRISLVVSPQGKTDDSRRNDLSGCGASVPTDSSSTQVTITGTGVPHLSPGRAGPGALVSSGDIHLQFDAGRATSLRLCEAGVRTTDLSALFVTHHHSDHLVGLDDVLFSRWLESQGRFTPLPVIAPQGPAIDFLDGMLDRWQADIDVRRNHTGRDDHPAPNLRPFDPAPTLAEPQQVWQQHGVRVLARSVHHEPVLPAVAYRVETPDHVVVISGDTRVCQEIADLAVGADVLVHEAFRTDALRPAFASVPHLEGIAAYHADTVQLGAMAQECGVPKLMLTHLIPAPEPGRTTKQDFIDDVRRGGYMGEVIVADDLDSITLKADPIEG